MFRDCTFHDGHVLTIKDKITGNLIEIEAEGDVEFYVKPLDKVFYSIWSVPRKYWNDILSDNTEVVEWKSNNWFSLIVFKKDGKKIILDNVFYDLEEAIKFSFDTLMAFRKIKEVSLKEL